MRELSQEALMIATEQLESLIKASHELDVYERFCNIAPLPASLLLSAARASMITADAKAPCLDTLQVSLWCQVCSTDNSTADILAIQNMTYNTVSQMCLDALKMAHTWISRDIRCGQCKTALIALVDFHHLDKPSKSDIVVRWFRSPASGSSAYQILTMSGAGEYAEANPTMVLAGVEAIPRAIEIALAESLRAHDLDNTAKILKIALREAPQLLCLVSVAALFIDKSELRGVVEAAAEAHINSYPNDFRGHSLMARVLMHAFVETNGTEKALLDESYSYAVNTLKLNANDFSAEAILFNCMRLSGEGADEIAPAFNRLVANHPKRAEPYYDYAIYLFDTNAQEAETLFERGAELEAADPDYLVGQARALMALNREVEAQTLLVRAKQIQSTHPLIAQLLAKNGPLGS